MRRLFVLLVAALVVPASAQAATNPVVAAAKRTATIKSSKLELNVKTTIPGRATMTLTGNGAHSGTSVELRMRTRAVGAPVTIDAIMLDERGASVMYMRSPSFQQQLPSGKSWLRVDLSKQAASLALDFSSLLNTSSFAPLEKGLVSTTRLGRETVAGASTTHYRAVIDIKRAARAVPAYGKQVAALEKATGLRLTRSSWNVWIGGDGRIRRMRFSTPAVAGSARGTTVQSITFLAYDVPVSISAPPRAQVFDTP
jgi:hypothetical protein